jgi:DNA-binding winged helix-turn-helix (wHTH) protein
VRWPTGPGEVISRQELIDQVWGVEHGADESLTRAISLLRSVLNTDKDLHSVIETIPEARIPAGCRNR